MEIMTINKGICLSVCDTVWWVSAESLINKFSLNASHCIVLNQRPAAINKGGDELLNLVVGHYDDGQVQCKATVVVLLLARHTLARAS